MTGKKIYTFYAAVKGTKDYEKGHTDHILALAVSSDSQYVASGGKDKSLCIWSVEQNKLLKMFKQHRDEVTVRDSSPANEIVGWAWV
jgi:ribosomal RNA-processing protein 9